MINIKTNEVVWVMGERVVLHRCDNCGELIDGAGQVYWGDKDFTLCLPCLATLTKQHCSPSRTQELLQEMNNPDNTIKRIPVPDELRWEIWERDNFTCKYCGSRRDLTIDHVIPVALGGDNNKDNLVTACRRCNSKKGAKPPISHTEGRPRGK